MSQSEKLETAKTYQVWIQLFLYRLQLPLSTDSLTRFSIGQLRQLATIFKSYCGEEMRDFDKSEMIRFISGHQHDPSQLKPMKKLNGILLPELEERRFRELFESAKDPWMRP